MGDLNINNLEKNLYPVSKYRDTGLINKEKVKKIRSRYKHKGQDIYIGKYDSKEECKMKKDIVLNHLKQYPNISVEDLKKFAKSIR